MNPLLDNLFLDDQMVSISRANAAYDSTHPGQRPDRQPVHTVYGGAQLFKSDTAGKMGRVALRVLETYARDFLVFSEAFGLPGHQILPQDEGEREKLLGSPVPGREAVRTPLDRAVWLAGTVYHRVLQKLADEPVEDFRIDFEDGFGVRPVEEERHHARRTAEEVAVGMRHETLPPFIGIRIKPFNDEYGRRSLETLNLFVSHLLSKTEGHLPSQFFVTLPKITSPAQVTAASESIRMLETNGNLAPGSIGLELMIETPESIFDSNGSNALPGLIAATGGRCTGVHFGVYDYTALLEITAAHQTMSHPACDFARHMMQLGTAGTGIWISDGATNVMPVPIHAGSDLSEAQIAENASSVRSAWRLAYNDNMRSLQSGFYQGWDLHPAQLPARYAAVFSFFLDSLDTAAHRLRSFVDKAAQASLVGDIFDDAATGQGLLNYFLRALNCGAISEAEAKETGLSMAELSVRSFAKILDARAGLS